MLSEAELKPVELTSTLEQRDVRFSALRTVDPPPSFSLHLLALSWLLRRGDDVVAIPGTTSQARLEENAATASLAVDDALIERIDAAIPADAVIGARLAPTVERFSDSPSSVRS